MKIGCIIQARTSSTRLPQKVLMELPENSGITVLERVVERVAKVINKDNIIVATSINANDEKIVDIAIKCGVQCYRGSLPDVLERYYKAAKKYKLDHIVRITADCPCIDTDVIRIVLDQHISEKRDYTSNTIVRTFPKGLDVEIMNIYALERAYNEATALYDREHVTSYIYSTKADVFSLGSYQLKNQNYSNIRATLDTSDDYDVINHIYKDLGSDFDLEILVRSFV
jgi:spore coat polysaccharide biosynthesis protein SpsF